ncbi:MULTISPECIES: NUDIX domain-containing protein [unclassified Ruminococcus]|uniref:NUDIX hydrolase n=1 Tax=unclassified Ruminococcus TaxID=2608920 RepID=UPI00210B91DF|nr:MULTISPECIES: NUDIX domain-containing protein [unclassified Ruminococcus]MCQ4023049.1 NUDIX domain-containing protein [Ruminococcus sp. zg-924]MCQ4115486.1 NUDIX domain-containing protein [Ruminococcus sp. zg-921]
MECWDIYDAERQKTGRTIQRGKTLEYGDLHVVVHVCIFNSKGEMLIQQRQPFKEGFPNMWDVSVGGSALAGETSAQAAQRETLEEIGVELKLNGQRPHLTINFEYGFDDFYLVDSDVDISRLTLQYEEVKTVKWATREEIYMMMKSGKFIPRYKSLVDLLFDMHGNAMGDFCD